MSESSAREFLIRLNSDDAYRAEVEKSVGSDDDALACVARRAGRDGYDFTPGDLEGAMRSATLGELSDAELDQVAGGFNPQPTPPALQRPGDVLRNILGGSVQMRF